MSCLSNQKKGELSGIFQVLGTSHSDLALARYNTDGSLDASFGDAGIVITDVNSGGNYSSSVNLQADGKILLGGTSSDLTIGSAFTVVRLNNDGSLDTSFSGDGKVTTDVGVSGSSSSNLLIVQADGKILLGGYAYGSTETSGSYTGSDFALVRYNSDGSLDTSFSSDGKITTDVGGEFDFASSVAVQADNKILLGGYNDNYTNMNFVLVRYNTDGSLDATFNGSSTVNHAPTGTVSITGNTGEGQT